MRDCWDCWSFFFFQHSLHYCRLNIDFVLLLSFNLTREFISLRCRCHGLSFFLFHRHCNKDSWQKKWEHLRSMSSCSRRVVRACYVMFSLFWFKFFFLFSILCVIQREFLNTYRNDDNSFAFLRRNAQYDISSHNIHMFACFDIRMFCDHIFNIWSIHEYDSSIHNILLLSMYIRAIYYDILICLSYRRSSISISLTKSSFYDFFLKFIVFLLSSD